MKPEEVEFTEIRVDGDLHRRQIEPRLVRNRMQGHHLDLCDGRKDFQAKDAVLKKANELAEMHLFDWIVPRPAHSDRVSFLRIPAIGRAGDVLELRSIVVDEAISVDRIGTPAASRFAIVFAFTQSSL